MVALARTLAFIPRSVTLAGALRRPVATCPPSASLARVPRHSGGILHAFDALGCVPYHQIASFCPFGALTGALLHTIARAPPSAPLTCVAYHFNGIIHVFHALGCVACNCSAIFCPSDALARTPHPFTATLHPFDARAPQQFATVFRPSVTLPDIHHLAIHHAWSSTQPIFHPTLSSIYSIIPRAHIIFIVIAGITGASFLLGLELDRSDGQNIVQCESIVYSETKNDGEEVAEGEQMLEEMTKQEKEEAYIKAIVAKEFKRLEDDRNSKGQDGGGSKGKKGGCFFARFLQRLEKIFGIPGRLMRLKTNIEESYVLAIAASTYLPTIFVLKHADITTKLREKHQEMATKAATLVGDVAGQPSPPSSSTGKMTASPSSGAAVQPSHCSSSTGQPSAYSSPSDVAGQPSPSSSSTGQLSASPSPGATENANDMGGKNDEGGE